MLGAFLLMAVNRMPSSTYLIPAKWAVFVILRSAYREWYALCSEKAHVAMAIVADVNDPMGIPSTCL